MNGSSSTDGKALIYLLNTPPTPPNKKYKNLNIYFYLIDKNALKSRSVCMWKTEKAFENRQWIGKCVILIFYLHEKGKEINI